MNLGFIIPRSLLCTKSLEPSASSFSPLKVFVTPGPGGEFRITGNQSTVRAGTEIRVKTERQEVSLSLAEMDQGSWVIFELPGFTKAASGTEQPSMDALRKANATSYFRGGDALWVKLVVTKPPLPIVRPTDLQASIAVSR